MEIGGEVSVTESNLLTGPEDQMHPLWVAALERREALAVVSELQEMRRLGVTRELCIPGLVAPVTERGAGVHLHEEIRPAAPFLTEKHALINHVSAGDHRLPCLVRVSVPVEVGASLADP